MATDDGEIQRIERAVGGDQIALQQLLTSHADTLSRYVASRLPDALRDRVDADDIVQQTFVQAFRSISRFQPHEGRSFQAWLLGISAHVLQDTVKRERRVKRGGHLHRIRRAGPDGHRSVADLVELLSAGSHSPSRSAMGHEAVRAVLDAIDALPDDNQQAVQLRLLQGKSLQETAELMHRSPRAIQGLVDRAKRKMRAALGRLSNYS